MYQTRIEARRQTPLDERIERLQRRRGWRKLCLSLLLTGLVTYLLFGVVFGIAVVKGDSMVPALQTGDVVLFCRLGGRYRTGDIVLLRADGETEHVKRVVGLPGQTVRIDERTGSLLIDGAPLPEPYIYEATHGKSGVAYPLTLGEGEYFLLGDHRENSKDSRNYGPVAEGKIDGAVLLLFRAAG